MDKNIAAVKKYAQTRTVSIVGGPIAEQQRTAPTPIAVHRRAVYVALNVIYVQ